MVIGDVVVGHERRSRRGVARLEWVSLVADGDGWKPLAYSHSGEAAGRKALEAYRHGARRVAVLDTKGVVSLVGGRA